ASGRRQARGGPGRQPHGRQRGEVFPPAPGGCGGGGEGDHGVLQAAGRDRGAHAAHVGERAAGRPVEHGGRERAGGGHAHGGGDHQGDRDGAGDGAGHPLLLAPVRRRRHHREAAHVGVPAGRGGVGGAGGG